jgi:hypothetical protein
LRIVSPERLSDDPSDTIEGGERHGTLETTRRNVHGRWPRSPFDRYHVEDVE